MFQNQICNASAWIYDHPAKPQLHRRPRTWVEARLNRSVYPLLFFASLQSSPRRMKKACREKIIIKITVFGLKYRVDQYREKNQRKALPVCLNKNWESQRELSYLKRRCILLILLIPRLRGLTERIIHFYCSLARSRM